MTLDQCLTFLDSHRVGVLSTLLTPGQPHTSVMHFSLNPQANALYFSTDRRSSKVTGIGVSPFAAFATGWSEEDWKTVQIRGPIAIVPTDDLSAVQRIHYRKHPQSEAFRDDPDTVFLLLGIAWLRYSDLGAQPEVIQEYLP